MRSGYPRMGGSGSLSRREFLGGFVSSVVVCLLGVSGCDKLFLVLSVDLQSS